MYAEGSAAEHAPTIKSNNELYELTELPAGAAWERAWW